jgi:D-glycero-D-manno-heptose 1,7-bisphosphate phosphatase
MKNGNWLTPAVFLDRDGVLNRAFVRDGKPYPPAGLEEFEILPGVVQAANALHSAGFRLIVVTNQPDVSKGTQSREVVERMHARLREVLPIDDIRTCYHADNDNCDCRKPKPGMLIAAAREHNLDLCASFMVGDRWRDVEAGRTAGCRTIFIDRNYGEQRAEQPDIVATSFPEASEFILNNLSKTGRSNANFALPTITLIVPALNEEKVITQTIRQIIGVVRDRFSQCEMLLIDDGSTDGTGFLMEELATKYPGVRVIHNQRNLGLGACYRRGLTEARYEYVMLLCGDGGMPASSLPAIFGQIGKADIVIPYITNMRRIKTPTRFVISRTYTALLNRMFGLRLNYYNGLAVHRTELVRCLDLKSDGFGFQAEALVELLKAGCSYVQIGVAGAEKTKRSSALRFRNVVNVIQTLWSLRCGIAGFDVNRVRVARESADVPSSSKARRAAAGR